MLLLLVLSLLVLPALLAVLPARLLPTRPNRILPRPPAPPTLVLVVLAVAGIAGGVQMRADPDTANVFDEQSEPRQANRFFEDNFGGSQFLQLAIDADLKDPTTLREIREIEESVRQVEGVAEVRSLVGPVAQVTEGFGGRRGIPSTLARTKSVVANLADHPAASQLMLSTADGAVVHIKLAPMDSAGLVATTEAVRAIVERHPDRTLRVGPTSDPEVDAARREHVRHRVARISGTELSTERFDELVSTGGQKPEALLPDVVALRKRALGTDELIEPLPPAVYERLEPETLLTTRGKALETYIREQLPELVEADAEGIEFVAEFLGQWIDEAKDKRRLVATCVTVGLPPLPEEPEPDPDAMPGDPPPDAKPELRRARGPRGRQVPRGDRSAARARRRAVGDPRGRRRDGRSRGRVLVAPDRAADDRPGVRRVGDREPAQLDPRQPRRAGAGAARRASGPGAAAGGVDPGGDVRHSVAAGPSDQHRDEHGELHRPGGRRGLRDPPRDPGPDLRRGTTAASGRPTSSAG